MKVVNEVFELQKKRFDGMCSMSNTNSDSSNNVDATTTSLSQISCRSLSFADTLAVSGAAAVEAARGPRIEIQMGRQDVCSADNRFLDEPIQSMGGRSVVSTSLPSAGLDSLGLRNYFKRLGLTEPELVALSGAHDLGRHVTLTGMPKVCLRNLTRTCLEDAPVLAPFITEDPDTLSNRYFQTMLRWNDKDIEFGEAAFIPTDVALVVDNGLKKHVVAFAKDEQLFFRKFRTAYQKLVDSTATTRSRF
jgi:catalase (peroxidase I)